MDSGEATHSGKFNWRCSDQNNAPIRFTGPASSNRASGETWTANADCRMARQGSAAGLFQGEKGPISDNVYWSTPPYTLCFLGGRTHSGKPAHDSGRTLPATIAK